jgi:hypothetical protein
VKQAFPKVKCKKKKTVFTNLEIFKCKKCFLFSKSEMYFFTFAKTPAKRRLLQLNGGGVSSGWGGVKIGTQKVMILITFRDNRFV